MTSTLITIYWRDSPAQVTAKQGRRKEKALLDARFQDAIDRAAMVAGKDDYDSYIEEWRRVERDCSNELEAEAKAEAARLETEYPAERLQRLVASGGVE